MDYDGEHYEIDAFALFRFVVDYATAPPNELVNDAQVRLGKMTEEVQRLRRKLRETEDLAGARAIEIDGLRQRAQLAEANVRRITSMHPAGSTARERELAELNAVMRARPGAYAGNEERNGHGR